MNTKSLRLDEKADTHHYALRQNQIKSVRRAELFIKSAIKVNGRKDREHTHKQVIRDVNRKSRVTEIVL